MADETRVTVPPVAAGATPAGEEDLASRIAAGSAFEDVAAESAPAGPVERPAAPAAAPTVSPEVKVLQDQLAALTKRGEEREIEAKLERQQYIGTINRLNQRLDQPLKVEAPPPAPVREPGLSDEQLVENLRSNAPATLRKFVGDAITEALGNFRREVGGRIDTASAATQNLQQRREAMMNGTKKYNDEILLTVDESQRAAFDKEAVSEVYAMYGDNWQQMIRPEDPYNAGSRVYMRWMREGKLLSNGGANGAAAGTGLREIVDRVTRSDHVTGSPGSGAPRGERTPTTIDELPNMSVAEKTAAKRVAKTMGLDERTWVANHLAAVRDDPNFGRG